jgi:hypothetical protein
MDTTRSLHIFRLSALVALLFLSGCGRSSSEGALTKREFLKRAGAICARAQSEQLQLVSSYVKKHPNAEEADLVAPAGVPPLKKELQRIRELELPAGDAKPLQAFFKAFESGLADAAEDPFDLLVTETNPFKKANSLAKAYGMKACANAP